MSLRSFDALSLEGELVGPGAWSRATALDEAQAFEAHGALRLRWPKARHR